MNKPSKADAAELLIERDSEGIIIPPPRSMFFETVARLRKERGMAQADVARKLRIPQTYISRWETTRVPSPEQIFQLEVGGFELQPGAIYQDVGWATKTMDVPTAVAADTRLQPQAKAMLIAAYEASIGG